MNSQVCLAVKVKYVDICGERNVCMYVNRLPFLSLDDLVDFFSERGASIHNVMSSLQIHDDTMHVD